MVQSSTAAAFGNMATIKSANDSRAQLQKYEERQAGEWQRKLFVIVRI